jgi:hypothetical protein
MGVLGAMILSAGANTIVGEGFTVTVMLAIVAHASVAAGVNK